MHTGNERSHLTMPREPIHSSIHAPVRCRPACRSCWIRHGDPRKSPLILADSPTMCWPLPRQHHRRSPVDSDQSGAEPAPEYRQPGAVSVRPAFRQSGTVYGFYRSSHCPAAPVAQEDKLIGYLLPPAMAARLLGGAGFGGDFKRPLQPENAEGPPLCRIPGGYAGIFSSPTCSTVPFGRSR